jgi:hypothetical protein
LGWLPIDFLAKAAIASSSILSAALYGCEAAHASEMHLTHLSSSLANALHGKAPRRSNDVLYNLLSTELEPWAVVCIRRVSLLRRMMSKNPDCIDGIQFALQNYLDLGFPGVHHEDEFLNDITPAPRPGDPLRRRWKADHHAWGPVGYLCYSLSHFGLASTPSFDILQNNEVAFNVLNMPIQYLKPLLTDAIRRQRALFVAAERAALSVGYVYDHNLMRRTLDALDVSITPAVRWVTTLSFWDNRKF